MKPLTSLTRNTDQTSFQFRRQTNAYIFLYRYSIVSTIVEINKLIAEKWKNLSEDEKDVYIKRAEADKARYNHEMVIYNQSHPSQFNFYSILSHVLLSLIHISEPTRPLYISYAVFCLKKKKKNRHTQTSYQRSILKRIQRTIGAHNIDYMSKRMHK
eukprot:TRINITY_DN21815_c0_g1_i1.p1 TRINITY_DN21815_c0_g1~~TRINITY_DN21815_c0_g1_i1.p1  ORF type:complete len:157 (+),score=10.47 TRINITY_DN21815_c0_g1_i1:252-722(+)